LVSFLALLPRTLTTFLFALAALLRFTELEAQVCGTPVVAFKVGGLPDIVDHQQTGYLATPFDTHDLAAGIQWVLAQRHTRHLGQQARDRAVERFSYPVVAAQYRVVYQQLVEP
jgi:glycosyltransferase involved in cell wall biosynthesis